MSFFSELRRRDVFRVASAYTDPVFTKYLDDPRMLALRRQLDSILDAEQREVLRIICFDNPVPDEWQLLPETCGAS
jgi:hypothetical protein